MKDRPERNTTENTSTRNELKRLKICDVLSYESVRTFYTDRTNPSQGISALSMLKWNRIRPLLFLETFSLVLSPASVRRCSEKKVFFEPYNHSRINSFKANKAMPRILRSRRKLLQKNINKYRGAHALGKDHHIAYNINITVTLSVRLNVVNTACIYQHICSCCLSRNNPFIRLLWSYKQDVCSWVSRVIWKQSNYPNPKINYLNMPGRTQILQK